jgi:hypothetical protein
MDRMPFLDDDDDGFSGGDFGLNSVWAPLKLALDVVVVVVVPVGGTTRTGTS